MKKTGIELIAEERQRQIEVKGFTTEHDKQYTNGELASAAACYAMTEDDRELETFDNIILSEIWPWERRLWKPTPEDRIKELEIAGSLIAAEIDRLQAEEEQK